MEFDAPNLEKIQELVDPVTAEKAISGTAETGVAPDVATMPRSIFRIGPNRIFIIKKYLQLIWDFHNKFKDSGRLLDVGKIIDNCFDLFDAKKLRNTDIYWKEHASANLRELTCVLVKEDYSNALTCIDITNSDVLVEIGQVERATADCLHNCAHFRTDACIENAKKFLNIIDPNITDDEIFDQMVALYLRSLYRILSKCNNAKI